LFILENLQISEKYKEGNKDHSPKIHFGHFLPVTSLST